MSERTARTEQVKDVERPLLDHVLELARRVRRVLVFLLSFFLFFFAFGYTTIQVGNYVIPVPYPSLFDSFSVIMVRWIIYHVLPPGLKLINLNPLDPMIASAYFSFFLAVFFSIPVIIREAWAFISPGLYEHERRLFKRVIVPALLLYAGGAAFAYFVIIPLMMKFVLIFTNELGVEPTLSLRAFATTVITMMAVTGLAFEYPLAMAIATYLGLVKAKTWFENWRWGVMGAFIIAWAISPGTTGGVIETTIGLILSALYFVGAYAAKAVERRKGRENRQLKR
ncbi:MAG: twin-arginine translocase subunit TatC [Sulfolobales archaeon]|nr:twin-arginine translocase subunit TatC [Sulfolobales archaeon]